MLAPSLANLSVVEFELIELTFNFNKIKYRSIAKQDDKKLVYYLTDLTNGHEYSPLHVTLKIPPKKLTENDRQKERFYKEYLNLGPDENEIEAWGLLYNELPKPIVIGLDRYLFTEEQDEYVLYHDDLKQRVFKEKANKNINPLDEVRRLANREYSIYKNKLVELNKSIVNKMVLSSFEEITPASLGELNQIKDISIDQIRRLKNKVYEFFKENISRSKNVKSDPNYSKIESYFSQLEKVIEETKNQEDDGINILALMNFSQFKKIGDLLKEFERFDKKSQEIYEDLSLYLKTINHFLSDSSKELNFHKTLSEICFNVIDNKGKAISTYRDIKTLSSGERQILILFTYLKFYNKQRSIFIIDEPELSLHPKWQEDFLEAVRRLTPVGTQLMIATHSPIIVGDNKEFCTVLLPYEK